MNKLIALLFASTCGLLLLGCKSLGVVQLSPDTYMASKTSAGGVFKSMASLKAEVISAANEFAASKGKIAVPISSQETPAAPFRNPSFEYQFRVVDKNDPEARRTALIPRADVVVESTDKVTADVTTRDEKSDIAEELQRLGELRKQGVITEEEFSAMKKRLIEKL